MRHWLYLAFVGALMACERGPESATSQSALSSSRVRLGVPIRVTTDGYYLAPRFSPDGRFVLFSGPKYEGLFVAQVGPARPVIRVSDEEYVGWAAKWTTEGIETRTRDGDEVVFRNPLSAPQRVVTGKVFDPREPKGRVHAFQEGDAIHAVIEGRSLVISEGRDRYFAPLVSPDQRFIVYEGLETGLFVYEVETARVFPAGRGNHPVWLWDSSGFVYDITQDDGVRLTSGDLYLFLVRTRERVRLTNTDDRIETHPMPSPDGTMVAFESEGAIYVAALLFGP